MKTDTIAAISTAVTDSGIGIIRVSGDDAISIVHSVFLNKKNEKCLNSYKSHTIHYGFIIDENETIIDEVIVSIMKAPYSYTTEDTVEINCHGGVFMMKKIMDIVLCAGARTAQPGEFTKRAFLNGRIDLSKAEAVMDIINSKNEFALKSSVKQLKGSVSEIVKDLREKILYEIAFIESALDDPEHISLDDYPEKLYKKNEEIINILKKLLDSADDGRILKEGINTVIVGKPNAGKSSLLNILVGEEKAIVTEIAGTTRDILEETIFLDGITLNITDTAGIRNTDDVVEKIGVKRAKKAVEESDLAVYVIDSSVPLDENDFDIIKMIKDKKTIILLNKSDLDSSVSEENLIHTLSDIDKDFSHDNIKVIKTSTKENEGIDTFTDTIKEMFFHGELSYSDEIYITNIRHKEAMKNAYDSMMQVQKSIEDNMPEDFYSIDLMSAYTSLGEIIGEEIGEDLVNEIFSKFCMGK
ncbi:MAG: tRNA uridine-5-carboxymethylaminomethyl(34) synthesis GTPase MnmE [Lachnospiraceae bacterium]|nr:tRNA uridine-5-carboxymethylaminomethyl(34) synthesis GTPase MnmE [Lachnospiraceae bacterium]